MNAFLICVSLKAFRGEMFKFRSIRRAGLLEGDGVVIGLVQGVKKLFHLFITFGGKEYGAIAVSVSRIN